MARKASPRSSKETTPRHVWLAVLGVAAVARREARTAAGIAFDEALRLRGEAARIAVDARDIARGAVMTLQEAFEAKVEPQVGRFSADVEARLAPVLDKLGLKPGVRKPARKVRKAPAKPAARRTAGGRTQAATRVARKGRG